MMSQRSKRELAEELQARYLKSNKKEKTRMLDEFVATTRYSRKYANYLLKNGVSRKQKKKAGRKKLSIAALFLPSMCGWIFTTKTIFYKFLSVI